MLAVFVNEATQLSDRVRGAMKLFLRKYLRIGPVLDSAPEIDGVAQSDGVRRRRRRKISRGCRTGCDRLRRLECGEKGCNFGPSYPYCALD